MKKLLFVFCALVALVACTQEAFEVEEPMQNENQEIVVDLTIKCSDFAGDTKAAAVKNNFAVNDVVFVFFYSVASPKYLEMKYNGDGWVATLKNDLTPANISACYDGTRKLAAIYLPYGSDYEVNSNAGTNTYQIQKNGTNYQGQFYYAKDVVFNWDKSESKLTGGITLKAAAPKSEGDKLVHFNVSAEPGTYIMRQDYMKNISFTNFVYQGSLNYQVSKTVKAGESIKGYYDNNGTPDDDSDDFISFSGVLDVSGVGNKEYRFVIVDKSDNSAYSRVFNNSINGNVYVGIGDIRNDAKWQHITEPYFSMSPTKLVAFAPGNLWYDSGTWKFHSHQYDYCFNDTTYADVKSNYYESGSFDIFAWGTSGWRNPSDPSWVYYQPWEIGAVQLYDSGDPSTNIYKNTYWGFGPDSPDDLTTYPDGDWAWHNPITWQNPNTGATTTYPMHTWRTPTNYWYDTPSFFFLIGGNVSTEYLRRDNYASKYGLATVVGKEGLIILPDNYVAPDGVTAFVGGVTDGWNTNVFNAIDWAAMEAKGAIFLPAYGRIRATEVKVDEVTTKIEYRLRARGGAEALTGAYWSSTNKQGQGEFAASFMSFTETGVTLMNHTGKNWGNAVRPIRDLN